MSDSNNANNPPGHDENDRPRSSASRSASSTSQQNRTANSPARPGTPAPRSERSPPRLNEDSALAQQDRTANSPVQPAPLYGWPRDPILDISSTGLFSSGIELSSAAILAAIESGRNMGPPFTTPFLGGSRTPQEIFEDELDASVFSNIPGPDFPAPEDQITSNVRNESPRGTAVSPFIFPQDPAPEGPRLSNQTVLRGDNHYYGPGLGRRNLGGRSIGAGRNSGLTSIDATSSSQSSSPEQPPQAPIVSVPSAAGYFLAHIDGPTSGAREYRARNPLDFPNFPGPTPPTVFERGYPYDLDQLAIEQDRLRASAATGARIHALLGLPDELQSPQSQFRNQNQGQNGLITPAPSLAPSIFSPEISHGSYQPHDIRRGALPGQIFGRRLPQPIPAPEFGEEELRSLINDPIFGPFPDADSVQLPSIPSTDEPRPDWGGHSPGQSSSSPGASRAVLETQRIAHLLEKYSFPNNKAVVERLHVLVVAKHAEYVAHHAMLQEQLATQSDSTDFITNSITDPTSTPANLANESATNPTIDLAATTEGLASEFLAGKAYLEKLPAALVELKELIHIMQKLHLQKLHPHHSLYTDAVRTASGVQPVYQFERLLACGQTEAYARFPVRPDWILEGPCLRMLRAEIRSPRKFTVFV